MSTTNDKPEALQLADELNELFISSTSYKAADKLRCQHDEIQRLRDWIREEGERGNVCTRHVLGEICGYCKCGKKGARHG